MEPLVTWFYCNGQWYVVVTEWNGEETEEEFIARHNEEVAAAKRDAGC